MADPKLDLPPGSGQDLSDNDGGQNGHDAPNARPHDRGSRAGDPAADSVTPGREYGAGGQVADESGVGAGQG